MWSPGPSRAHTGPQARNSGGLASQISTPLGSTAPKRIRLPFVSRPQSRAVTRGLAAPGPRAFLSGPGTVSAADRQVMSVAAKDRQVMSAGAADWQLERVTAADYEP